METATPTLAQKRLSGRTPGTNTPVKKRKLSPAANTPLSAAPSRLQTPTTATPTTALPSRLIDNAPLPTLPAPQPPDLPASAYQSVQASNVLRTALARSQHVWTHTGLLERYWVKPETGKNAKPPPQGNPDVKWMKHKGECRIRVEPHILECQMYVEEKPKTAPAAVQKQQRQQQQQQQQQQQYAQQYGRQGVQGLQYAGGQPQYQGQSQSQQVQHQQQQQQQQQAARTLPPVPIPQQRPPAPRTPTPSQGGKSGADPVISKLAARASSDPELKVLMKGVATGNATPEQLKVFQRHIDELQAQIKKEKDEREAKEAAEEDARRKLEAAQPVKQEAETNQYEGINGHGRTSTPQPPPTQSAPAYAPQQPQQQQPRSIQYAPPPPAVQPTPAQSPTHHAVILSFSVPGATEDRFLFPRHSILESLSPNHLLASFILTRKGSEVADSSLGLDRDKTYWQPMTIMLEVKLGLEELVSYVRRWVRPADEVRRQMIEVMGKCERMPERFLALRLPVKGSVDEAKSGEVTKEGTPMSVSAAEEVRKKSNVKLVKKAAQLPASAVKKEGSGVGTPSGKEEEVGAKDERGELDGVQKGAQGEKVEAGGEKKDQAAPVEEPTEGGRPRRTTRKSVRISEA